MAIIDPNQVPVLKINDNKISTTTVNIPVSVTSAANYWHTDGNNLNGNITIPQKTHVIQGRMLTYRLVISPADEVYNKLSVGELKRQMAMKIAEEMLIEGCMEFTKMYDPINSNNCYHARIFVTPNDQVKLLRENGY
jgi:hypothetical protein